ncbi:putative mechanosensitive ion channel MscS [Medicago truncatula]|uniref:Mechanosensitive ion channel protein n=1 Tax=Medicago truncatula TaxID=3880 RepID=G7J8E1_MEDTR|nr:mechanosensitive ion channel protein 10 [Medicago truncatula]XP_024635028.1 mechanosensitive ion channel protein 10 [Medicago truncatula]XP_039687749.1 mechanosensitive ion channel protein 10 [Medicago truncatula]AES73448.1 mechanosensitive ion channel family protein [Medicago truncatula]RHN70499.1 putative mechanosensitive ion channel MscS [Medicago truncatula]
MDSNKHHGGGEVSMMENRREVVVPISNVSRDHGQDHDHDHELKVFESSPRYSTKSPPLNCASPEIRFIPSPNKPPKSPAATAKLTTRKSFKRSVYSKPKSRFGEQPYPIDETLLEENVTYSNLQEHLAVSSPYRNTFNKASHSPNNKSGTVNRSVSITSVVTPRTPLMASPGPAGEDLDEIIFRKVESSRGKRKRLTTKVLIELFVFVCIAGSLLASLTVEKLRRTELWSLRLWRYCMLVMVTFCGMLVTKWFMHILVFLIEMNFLLKKKVLYFVHGLKKCVQVFIWISLVLLTWVLLINRGAHRSKLAAKILNDITWTLVSLLIGAFLWVIKTLLLKVLASSFHVKSFFDRIQESIFHQYVLQTLSGPPLMEEAEKIGGTQSIGHFSFRSTTVNGGTKKDIIDMAKLHKMKQGKVSSWTMKILVDAVMNSRLSTISNSLDESFYDVENEPNDKEITNEMEATAAAYYVFRNVAASPSCQDIDENELRRFLIKEEVPLVFPLLAQSETGLITRKSLADWVLKVYQERKALAHALSDTKTAVKQLNKLVTGVLVVVTIIVWLLLMEIATTKVLVFLSSQLVLAAFMFGNTCKNIFEAIIFVFVMHPFDVGDRCVIDGVELLVEEMNILTTVFLKLNNEKLYYPNSVLASKPISNYYRSPNMVEKVEFSVDFTTPAEKIGALKEKVKRYLEKNPQYWHPNFGLVVKEIENVNNIKMGLFVTHTMNFQEFGEKTKRRSELVMEVKKIFEDLNIRYNLLPQGVHLRHMEPDASYLK